MTNTVIHTFDVPDMSCQHCIDSITKEVLAVPGVSSLDVDLKAKVVTVTGGPTDEIIAALDEAGFDAAST